MIGTFIKACPVCGGQIEVSELFQYAHDFRLNKNGKLSKKYKKRDVGSMEVAIAGCLDCGEYWDSEQFAIDQDDRFIDYKHDGD